jgi:hypothetical protein
MLYFITIAPAAKTGLVGEARSKAGQPIGITPATIQEENPR